MSDEHRPPELPSPIKALLSDISQALVPECIRVLNRLIGAAGEIPLAWFKLHSARIDNRREAEKTVSEAIAKSVAARASEDTEILDRAMSALICKEYRKQINREAVAVAMIEELQSNTMGDAQARNVHSNISGSTGPDDDWLNVFERYAEDASTEKVQRLWGRVLAGELRSPGRYSLRVLRYLSEFSRADAERFSYVANNAFSSFAPEKLVHYPDDKALLLQLGADGLITPSEGSSMNHQQTFDHSGVLFIREENLAIKLHGVPNSDLRWAAFPLTELGKELLSLLPGRDPRAVARKVASAIRTPAAQAADLVEFISEGQISIIENLWDERASSGGASAVSS